MNRTSNDTFCDRSSDNFFVYFSFDNICFEGFFLIFCWKNSFFEFVLNFFGLNFVDFFCDDLFDSVLEYRLNLSVNDWLYFCSNN